MGRHTVHSELVPQTDFLGLAGITHLYSAAECPMLGKGADAVADYTRWKSRAEAGRAHHSEITRSCKSGLACLLDVAAEDIALLGSSSDAICAIAATIDFQPGDNVVINDLEFPSVVLPWLRLRDRGIEVRMVRHVDWAIPAESLLAAVDDRTRILALSHVSYVNGWRHDLEAISAALAGTRTRLLLDATQSLGVFTVPARLADYVVASTYKWLLGTHGLGVLYVNPDRVPPPEPAAIGWFSVDVAFTDDRFERYSLRGGAGRFETGYLNFPAIYALDASVSYLLKVGIDRISDHAHALGDDLIAGLRAHGLQVTTPDDRTRRGASVTFLHERAAEIGLRLAAEQVHVWAGDGRVRASTHAFNSSRDVDRYLDVLTGIVGSLS
jgi:selenocysteine lyase/cysteine desulfurase